MPLKVEFSDKNNKFQYDGHANELPSLGRGKLYIGDRDMEHGAAEAPQNFEDRELSDRYVRSEQGGERQSTEN